METNDDNSVNNQQIISEDTAAQHLDQQIHNVETTNEAEGQPNAGEEDNEDNLDNDGSDDNNDGGCVLSQLYGVDDDFEDDSNNDDNSIEDSDVLMAFYSETLNNNKRSSDSSDPSGNKRRSEGGDSLLTKRIKSEPFDAIPENTNPMTTTIEAVVSDETSDPLPDIPNNSLELMSYLLNMNANDLDANDWKQFPMTRHFQDISQKLVFTDFELFKKSYIPYILTELWKKLCIEFNTNHKNVAKPMSLKPYISILTKAKTNKMRNGIEIRCVAVVRSKEEPVFKFGQLITIQTAVQSNPDSVTHVVTKKKYFGYIINHCIRATDADNQSEVNHLKLLKENKRDSVIIEDFCFMTKYSDELYIRNDTLLVAEPIANIHNNHLEARSVFKFQEISIFKQIFSPLYNSKVSGLMVDVNERKFTSEQIEIIQKAIDVVANSSPSYSCFMAINGSKNSAKTLILIEIIRQIVNCQQLSPSKVVFTSSDSKSLTKMNQMLRSLKIKSYLIESDIENSLKDAAIKHIEQKMNKETDQHKKQLYDHCLSYFTDGQQLTVESILFKNSILDKFRPDMINGCSVIMGRIEDLCNDVFVYKYFSNESRSIRCCIIDDAMTTSEPQFYSLLYFGFKKFIFAGHYSEPNYTGSDKLEAYGLNRSFFQRYYSLYLQNKDENQSTVFNV